MPNHFHFMLLAKPEGCVLIKQQGQLSHLQVLSKTIGKTLSSYTQAINIQNKTTGTLFQKKTKAKCLTDISFEYDQQDYLTNCFYYIHNNPLEARIVNELQDWEYSSWSDYYGLRQGTLCKKEIIRNRAGFTDMGFRNNQPIIDKKVIEHIW